jgi:hypothetical protein
LGSIRYELICVAVLCSVCRLHLCRHGTTSYACPRDWLGPCHPACWYTPTPMRRCTTAAASCTCGCGVAQPSAASLSLCYRLHCFGAVAALLLRLVVAAAATPSLHRLSPVLLWCTGRAWWRCSGGSTPCTWPGTGRKSPEGRMGKLRGASGASWLAWCNLCRFVCWACGACAHAVTALRCHWSLASAATWYGNRLSVRVPCGTWSHGAFAGPLCLTCVYSFLHAGSRGTTRGRLLT